MVSLANFLTNPPTDKVVQDLITAKYWWIKASEAGNTYAMYRLGRCFERGIGFSEANFKEAYKWYKLSASNGNEKAKTALKGYKKSITGKIKIKEAIKTSEE